MFLEFVLYVYVMSKKAEIKCTVCGNEMGINENPFSGLDLSEFESGDVIDSVCMGDCSEASTEHEILSIEDREFS